MAYKPILLGQASHNAPINSQNGQASFYAPPPAFPAKLPGQLLYTDELRVMLDRSLRRLRTKVSGVMNSFYGVNQGVEPNEAIITPVFGLSFVAPQTAKQNADKSVKVGDLGPKYGIAAEDIFSISRIIAGLMLVGGQGNDAWSHDLAAPISHPIVGAIAAAASRTTGYAAANSHLFEVATEAIDDAINTACGNDLGARAKFRTAIENGSDPKLVGHLVKAVMGELVAYASVNGSDSIALTYPRITSMPLSVEHALDDLPLAMAEGYDYWMSQTLPTAYSCWAGPVAFIMPAKAELESIKTGVIRVAAFRLYPLCMSTALKSGDSFFSAQESVGLDPFNVLSSAAAICGCSFGVVWPTLNIGGLNHGAVDSPSVCQYKPGKVIVAREVHNQAVAKSMFCVTHDWNDKSAKARSIAAENDIIAMLGNICCRQTDVMLYNEEDKSVRHSHTLETRLLPGKLSIGLPPSFSWTNVGRTGILASAKFQAEQVFIKGTTDGTMLESRKYHKEKTA